MENIGKYDFDSKQQAEEKIKSLGTANDENGKSYPTHRHSIRMIDEPILLSKAIYNDSDEIVTEAVYSEFYSVDVIWQDLETHPIGWAEHSVNIETEGVHGFAGLSYQAKKFKDVS